MKDSKPYPHIDEDDSIDKEFIFDFEYDVTDSDLMVMPEFRNNNITVFSLIGRKDLMAESL